MARDKMASGPIGTDAIGRRAFSGEMGPGGGDFGLGGGTTTGQSVQASARDGADAMRGAGPGGVPGRGGTVQGTWLSNQQYKEYLQLLKDRAQAQQVISVPLNPASYPTVSLGSNAEGLRPYSVTQPGYGFLAPPAGGRKASGYGGLPSPRATGLRRQIP